MVKHYSGDDEIHDDGQTAPTWVYHPTEGSKVVPAAEAAALLDDGWFDTPAFPPAPIPGDTPVNLDKMTKSDLASFAKATHALDLAPELTKAAMIEAITAATPA